MSSDAHAAAPHDLVIVRRRVGADHSGHHGGVWKIAYADFMTAMMAFFLVMWLINATDKQTLTAVASYFNPVRLTDKVTNPKGLHEINSGARGQENRPGESNSKEGNSRGDPRAEASGKMKAAEEALFSDPYAILAKLAALASSQLSSQAMAQTAGAGAAGEAFRDPFEPDFRQLAAELHLTAAQQRLALLPAEAVASDTVHAESGAIETAANAPAAMRSVIATENAVGEVRTGEPRRADPPVTIDPQLEAEIRQIAEAAPPGRVPHLELTGTPEGILISLTDDSDFGMFAIASAEPRPELIAMMEKIARILSKRNGRIVVRGHTDGRPFRSASYDNWRLSAARAHMAYFMLVRGGVDERRFERIEGHADRSLKVADDPEAARNRRIEILLRMERAS